MAGLLDGGYSPDPLAMGLLGMGGALLTPRQLGGGIGPAMNAFSQQAMQAQMLKRQAANDVLNRRFLEAKIVETDAEASERKRKNAAAEAAQARQDDFWKLFGNAGPQSVIAQTGGLAPTQANAAMLGQPMPINSATAAAALRAGIKLDDLQKVAEARNWGRDEVARVIEGADPQGRPQSLQTTKFGDLIGAPIPKAYEKKFQDTGGSIGVFDPYTLAQAGTIGKSQTPDSKASNAVAWANNAIARQRLEEDRRQFGITDSRLREQADAGNWQTDWATGLQVNSKTGQTRPIMQGDKPLGARPKDPTEVQAKDNLFARRAVESEQAIIALGDKPSIAGVATKNNLSNIPLIGGAIGAASNFALSPESQRYDQAKRNFINAVLRRESGAVISDSEFKNADIQYFPQPGDSDDVKLQKAQNRRTAIDGLATGAGSLAKDMPKLPPPGAQGVVGAGASRAPAMPGGPGAVLRFDAQGNLVQ